MVQLIAMTDDDFAWLMGEGSGRGGLSVATGGLAPREVTALVRRVTAEEAPYTSRELSWMVAEDAQVVGMISCTKPAGERRYEIGYGTAPACMGRGVATAAVAAMLDVARDQGLFGLTAETSVSNPASQRVLEKNGFVRRGGRVDAEDGPLVCWSHDLGVVA